MTPEEIQRTMDFILASQANSVVRMDRLEENIDQLGKDLAQQKETVDVLAKVSRDLLKVEANLRRPNNPRQDNS